MFAFDHAFEWSSIVLVVVTALMFSAARSRRTLRERQLEAVRWNSDDRNSNDSLARRAESLYF